MNTIRQMAKMTCAMSGKSVSDFYKEFFHCTEKGTGFRENVIRELSWIESIDPQCFCRIHKNIPHRIVPYVLLVPTYGDVGFCWEPFDRYNRLSSRRTYCDSDVSAWFKDCVSYCGCWFKMAGCKRESFIWLDERWTYWTLLSVSWRAQNEGRHKAVLYRRLYSLATKESMGTQKLEKEVRGIFLGVIFLSRRKQKMT